MKKIFAIGIAALLVCGVGAVMIAAYTKDTDMRTNGTEFPEDDLRALLRKYNVAEDDITINGLEYTTDELIDMYRKYNITENDIKFAMGELPHFLEGTILDGKHRVIATNTGKPPKYLKEGGNYTLISIEEMIAIEEDARERYIEKYGVDPGNTKENRRCKWHSFP